MENRIKNGAALIGGCSVQTGCQLLQGAANILTYQPKATWPNDSADPTPQQLNHDTAQLGLRRCVSLRSGANLCKGGRQGHEPFPIKLEKPKMCEKTISFKEALAILGMSEPWLRKQVAAGNIPSFQLGRLRKFRESDLEKYLQSRKRGQNAV